MMIRSEHKAHTAACEAAEMTRQSVIGSAKLVYDAGGSHATYAAAVKAAEIAFYRSIIASCVAQGLPSSNFVPALLALGTGGA
ncbi:hypothetical protein [Bradyrhizobium sp. URHC0002]